jgi:mannose-1-phosphate guanylyltransferase
MEELMMTRFQEPSRDGTWSVVLAGGEGKRTRSFIERWLGYHKPKQYCAFVGRRSLFQHTVDRADRITPSVRRVVVAAQDHRPEVFHQLRGRAVGTIILQPQNRGTAPGVFLTLTYVKAREPDAIVTLFPSDHFVHPEERFALAVAGAQAIAREMEDRLVLLGVRPQSPETEYGWIEAVLDRETPGGFRTGGVRGFVEKPSFGEAQAALFRGALWNTLIVTGKLTAFWKLGSELLPEIMVLFEELGRAVGSTGEDSLLQEIYRSMPVRDFSSDFLQRRPEALVVMELAGVAWSDWGRPERIRDTLRAIGKEPAFADECRHAGRAIDPESKMLFSAVKMPQEVRYGREKVDRTG